MVNGEGSWPDQMEREIDRMTGGEIIRGCTCSFKLELVGCQRLSRDSTCSSLLVARAILGKQAISWNFVRDTISLEYSMMPIIMLPLTSR